MKYVGSKRLVSKHILPIMLSRRKNNEQYWVEPFVGGGNMIDKVEGNRLGSDVNFHTINALLTIRDCAKNLPKNNKEFTEKDYEKLKLNDSYMYKSYAGFCFSFGSIWLSCWRRNYTREQDDVRESYNSAIKQSRLLQNVFWQWCRDMSQKHTIFISEYDAPLDFELLWEKEMRVEFKKTTAIERLYTYG